jgi:ABC-type glycerol-3-phosphate transport system substrate-binding protein
LAEFSALVHEQVVYDRQNRVFVADKELKSSLGGQSSSDYEQVAGYGFSVDPWHFLKMMLQYGGKLTNEKGNEVYFDSEEAFNAMNFYVRAVTEGWGYRTEGYNHQQDFGAQKVAFIITSVVSRKFMEGKLNFPYGVASVPLSGNKKSIMSGTNICIFSSIGEERAKGAWDFLKWLSSAEISAEWARRSFYVPTRKSSLELPEMKKFLASVKGGDAAIVQLEHGETEPPTSAWYRCRIILRTYMEKIISIVERGDQDPDQVIRDNLREANQLMNRELSRHSLD